MSEEVPTGPVAAVHIADIGAVPSLRRVLSKPPVRSIPGLRSMNVGMAARLGQKFPPKPDVGRVGLVSFWDNDDSLSAFHQSHPLAAELRSGWHARLEPLRAHGTWPGLDESVSRSRKTDDKGPFVVLTLARFRFARAIPFFRTSASAEQALLESRVSWATAVTKPPFVSTCSIWDSEDALTEYAYSVADAAHPGAIATGRKKHFHKQEAFIRFRPYQVEGELGGDNPLPAQLLA